MDDKQEFLTGGKRKIHDGQGRFDLLPARALSGLAKHYELGVTEHAYDERNWEKGLPVSIYIDHALRHLMGFLVGDKECNHLAAACWNAMCCYDTILRIQEGKLPEELYDLPEKVKLEY